MNGSNGHFIELTEDDGSVVIIGLRYVSSIRRDDDGGAVLFLAEGLPFRARESYEDVRLMLMHTQPPEARVNEI